MSAERIDPRRARMPLPSAALFESMEEAAADAVTEYMKSMDIKPGAFPIPELPGIRPLIAGIVSRSFAPRNARATRSTERDAS